MAASAIPTATPPTAPSTGAAASANANTANAGTDMTAATAAEGSKDFVKTLTKLLSNDSNTGNDALATEELSDALLTDPSAVPDLLMANIAQTLGIVPDARSGGASVADAAARAMASVQLQTAQADAATADVLKMVATAAKQGQTDAAVFELGVSAGDATKDGGVTDTANGVNALGVQSNTAQAAEQRAQLHIHERVGTPAWREEVGAKLNWMIERGVQSGSLRLSPDNLGPLEVRISVQNDQVSVWFGAAHADTRAALENALPRLRELFAAQGMSLADAGVFREPPKHFQQGASQDGARGYTDSAGVTDSGTVMIQSRIGLLDAYA